MATSISQATKEKANFVRLCRLLIDGGTRVLRDVFDKIYPSAFLYTGIHSPTVHATLKSLRSRRILTAQQWQHLYPSASSASCIASTDFDITLLFLLLRNICSLVPPPTGWDKVPVNTDITREADLVRLKFYRNTIFAHISETSISDKDFEGYWNEIGSVITRLGGSQYKAEVERLKVASIDEEEEASILMILEEWQDYEKYLKTCVKETEERVMEKLDKNEEKISEKLDEAERRITDKIDKVRGVLERTVHSDDSQSNGNEEKTATSVTYYNITVKDNAQCVAGDQASSLCIRTPVRDFYGCELMQNKHFLIIGEKSYNLKTTTRWHTELQHKAVPFHLLPSIRTDNIFTSLVIQYGRKPLKHNKEGEPRNELLDWYGKVCGVPVQRCQDIFTGTNPEKRKPKTILVVGKPGIGKTLFCQKLIRDWARNKLFDEGSKSETPDFKFTYFLTFRQLNFVDDNARFDLMGFLNRSSLLEDYSLVDIVLFEYILNHKEEVLVILDAYDEYSKRNEIVDKSEENYPNDPRTAMPVSVMCAKLIKGKIMREAVVLITSRPAEADELGDVSFDEYVEITGFSSKQVKEYIEKYFQGDEAAKKVVQEHILENENLVSFGHIPVLCFLMCWHMQWQIQINSQLRALPVTVTELCTEVIQVFVQKHHTGLKVRHHSRLDERRRASTELLGSSLLQMFQKRRHSSSTQESVEGAAVSPFQEKVLDKISKLAAKLLIEKKLSFSIQDMEHFGLTRQEIENLQASGLLQCGPSVRIRSAFEVEHYFSFTHLILQEYLAALWFVKERKMPIKDMAKGMVCQFMAGVMSLGKDRKLLEKLINWIKSHPSLRKDQKLLLTVKCLYEFKDVEFAKMIVEDQYQRYFDDGHIVFLGITDVDCVLVSFLLDTFSSLNEIQTRSKKTLFSLRKKPTLALKTLYIGMSTLTLTGFQRISNSLSNEFCSVTEIEAFDCGLGDDCAPCFSELLVKGKVSHMSMNVNKLTDKTAAVLCQSLNDQRCQLTRLNLSYNEISDAGAELLCKSLLDPSCQLTRLVMYKNSITGECKKSMMAQVEIRKPDFDLRL